MVSLSLNPEDITYEYIPGPFMKVYVNAKKNPDKNENAMLKKTF